MLEHRQHLRQLPQLQTVVDSVHHQQGLEEQQMAGSVHHQAGLQHLALRQQEEGLVVRQDSALLRQAADLAVVPAVASVDQPAASVAEWVGVSVVE
jgi:hypothetical protein